MRHAMIDVRAHHARPRDESTTRAEVVTDAGEQVMNAELFSIAREARAPQGRGDRHARCSIEAARALQIHAVDITEHQSAVDIGNTIVVVAKNAVGVGDADTRLPTEIVLRA